jgi:hypothetical protein
MEIEDKSYFNMTLTCLNNNAGLLLLHMGSIGSPLSPTDMRGITGMSPKTLNDTLALLTHRGLIERASDRTWKLTALAWATLTACCGRPQEAAHILRCSEQQPNSDDHDGADSTPQAQNLRPTTAPHPQQSAQNENNDAESTSQAQNLRPPAAQHPQQPARDEYNDAESASQAQILRPPAGWTPADGKNDHLESTKLNRLPSPALEPVLSPSAGGNNDDRESANRSRFLSPQPARTPRSRALSLEQWPALNKLKKQKELKDLKDLEVLKNLKIFKTLSTTTTNPSIENSSSSNNLNPRARDPDITPVENGASPPKNNLELQPGDILSPDELIARLSSYLPGDTEQPGPYLFEQDPFASRLDFLLRHAPAIASIRFPFDDRLDQYDRIHGTRTNHAAYKLLHLLGIRGDLLSGLANRFYATPEYVRALMAKSRSLGDSSVIKLTTRIEQREPARAIDAITGHLMDCNCPICAPARQRAASQYRSLNPFQDTS